MNLTQIVIVAIIAGLLIYDVIAPKIHQPFESAVLKRWGQKWTLLPFCAGLLLGHWFFNGLSLGPSAWGFALPVMVGLLAWDIYVNVKGLATNVWYRWPGLWASIGVPMGFLLWGQKG